MTRAGLGRWAAALAAAIAIGPAQAGQLTVGAGAAVDLGSGQLDLGCADFDVDGVLSAGTQGYTAARNVAIGGSGVILGGSGVLGSSGDWANAGGFIGGTSTVRWTDECSASAATVSGSTSFANLQVTTSSGKRYEFASGSTQTMMDSLALSGQPGNLLEIRSTLAGIEARFDLQSTTQQNTAVDVMDNHAVGETIEVANPFVEGSNVVNWMPEPGALSLGAGAGLLALLDRSRRRRR